MNKTKLIGIIAAAVVLGAALFYGYQRLGGSGFSPREDVLSQMPAEASAVLYFDLHELRQSPFLESLYKWVPQTKADPDYEQFLQSTGFNYETDLERVGIALLKHGQDTTLFAVADGRFDQKKISAYAVQTGTRENRSGREYFSVPQSGSGRRITFMFLRNDRITLTNGSNLENYLSQRPSDLDAKAWGERFRRLAGSPIFAVVRQDVAASVGLSSHAPGGLQSPELSALIDRLQWITVAGKPEGDHLRVVLEGEGTAETTTRQLSDVINGLLVLAQAGLSEQKMRQQLQPDVREAYLEMLKSAEVSQIDRGETKSVRLMFDLTPKFLEAARTAIPLAPAVPQTKPFPNKSTIRN